MKSYMKVTSDFTDDFNKIVRKFRNDDILVGIPEAKTDRKDDEKITNAFILAINEFGSPANNIPARPVMTIGLKMAEPQITEAFKKCAVEALSRGLPALSKWYNRIGIIASTSIKKVINSQEGIDPPSEATLRARESRGFKGTKALLVTGQLRNAITYVVRGEE